MRKTTKAKAFAKAIKENRKVIWKDANDNWHAATDRNNTPNWAVETEDVKP